MAARPIRHPALAPSHPGELFAQAIAATGKGKTDIARMIGLSRQSVYDIINGKQPVTPSVAVRLGKLFGNGPVLWINMQAAYDLWHAEREVDVASIPTLEAAA